jgi:hypothetical protein
MKSKKKASGPRDPGQATALYNHTSNGKPVGTKKPASKGSKEKK